MGNASGVGHVNTFTRPGAHGDAVATAYRAADNPMAGPVGTHARPADRDDELHDVAALRAPQAPASGRRLPIAGRFRVADTESMLRREGGAPASPCRGSDGRGCRRRRRRAHDPPGTVLHSSTVTEISSNTTQL
jgi:hypothetical protein